MEDFIAMLIFLVVSFSSFFILKKRHLRTMSWISYVAAGIVVSAFRLFILFNLNYRMRTHTMTSFWVELAPLALRPESLLAWYLSPMEPTIHQTLFAGMLVVGSFLWALPFLVVGSKENER